jgi:TDG/mug DNA glycosylase family protein
MSKSRIKTMRTTRSVAGRQRGLAPVWEADTRVLVLGSFPGVASLAAGQYYAHPRNHFWPLMGELLRLPLPALTYDQRLHALTGAGVGLWDTIVGCRREGSLDGAIREPVWGDPAAALAAAPKLALVCFNGRTAARALPRWRDAGLATLALPSTSPAYTLPLAAKLEAWRAAVAPLRGNRRQR